MPAKPSPQPTPKRTKKQTKKQQTVERVMHAFKEGDLRSSAGTPVKTRKQAIAIALSESGQSMPTPTTPKRTNPKAK